MTVFVSGNMLPFGKISFVTAEPSAANLYVILTGKRLYSSTMKEETEKRGDSIADCRDAPFPMVSSEFKVLRTSVLLKTYFVISRITGVLVASPIISTALIYSVL